MANKSVLFNNNDIKKQIQLYQQGQIAWADLPLQARQDPVTSKLHQDREATKVEQNKLDQTVAGRPTYNSITNEAGYKNLDTLANTQGDLPQYTLLKQQAEAAAATGKTGLARQLNDELQNLAISGNGSVQNAYSQLATGGGLSSGARERIASGSADEQLKSAQAARLQGDRSSQDIDSQLQTGLLDLGAKSAADKLGLQTTLLSTRQSDLNNQNNLTQSQYNQGIEVQAAKAKALQERDAVASQKKGGTIICTKLNGMGLLDDSIFAADKEFARWCIRTSPGVHTGYLAWARYVVDLIDFLPIVGHIIAPSIRACANEMAYRADGTGRPNLIGKIVLTAGWHFSALVFKITCLRRRFA